MRIRCSGSASDRALVLARHVRPDSAAAVVAGLREPRGSVGVRTLARRAPADRRRSFSAPLTVSRQASANIRGAMTHRAPRHGVLRLRELGSRTCRAAIPPGASAWGVEDLVGNGWEWTRHRFAPFPGFRALASYPEYSADFFDGQHFVMKGASPATARDLLRPTFRNWFRPRYPYVYATFRCVKSPDDAPLAFADDVAVLPDADATAAAVALSLRRPRFVAVRGDLPPAVVSHHAHRAALLKTHASAIFDRLTPSRASSNSAPAAARSW